MKDKRTVKELLAGYVGESEEDIKKQRLANVSKLEKIADEMAKIYKKGNTVEQMIEGLVMAMVTKESDRDTHDVESLTAALFKAARMAKGKDIELK